MRCTVHADGGACPGCGCVKLHELEAVVYGAMVKKLKDFKTLTGRKKAAKISPKLTAKRQTIFNEIAKLSADAVSVEKMESISGYLDDWGNISFEDKQQVVGALITVIRATNEKVEIE